MTLLNLSFVTRSLVNLLDRRLRSSPAWPTGATLAITPEPADRQQGTNVLGLYLYHIIEDAHYKNLPAPDTDATLVQFTSMALNLYYQVSAHCDAQDDDGIYREQLMMGLALKTLHDFPVLDDSTVVNGQPVFVPGLRGNANRLRINLLPVVPEKAVEYWTAGSNPLRLANYLQVSVVLLEPEESSRRASRVLQYGVYSFVNGAPRLVSSRNGLQFTVPGETAPREVELLPAQVPVGGQVAFLGTDLAGDQTTLLLRTGLWPDAGEVGADWGVSVTEDRLLAQVQTTAAGADVLPGVYTAAAAVTRTRMAPGGLARAFVNTSNETPFMITPRIDSITPPTAAGLSMVNGYIFQHPALPVGSVVVFVGDARLEARPAAPLAAGQFRVVSPSALELVLPAGLAPGLVPFRAIVNGAESAPNWIRVP